MEDTMLSLAMAELPPRSPVPPRIASLPKRAVSEQTTFSEMDASTMSSRSTSLPSVRSALRGGRALKKTVSGLFKKKKKDSLVQLEELCAEHDSRETAVVGLSDEESRSLQERDERDRAVLESLDTVAKRLGAAKHELEQATTATSKDLRIWIIRSASILGVAFLIAVLEPSTSFHAWLIVALVACALMMSLETSTSPNEVSNAAHELEKAQDVLRSTLKSLETTGLEEAPSKISHVEDTLREEEAPSRISMVEDTSSIGPIQNVSILLTGVHKSGWPPGFDLSGYRFNCFASTPGLDFEKHVLALLPSDRQATFLQFEKQFWARFDSTGLESQSIPDRFTLLRFLQSDKYDIEKACVRMMKTVAWRIETKCDEFVDNPDWDLMRRAVALRPKSYCGFDKNYRVLCVEKLGEFFGSEEAFKGISFPDWIKVYAFEQAFITSQFRLAIEKHGAPYSHRLSFIGDLSGIRFMTAMKLVPFLKMLVKEVETSWPEFAGDVALVNAPPIVTRLFSIVKKFLDPTVAEKVIILGSDCSRELIARFGADNLPVEYGGHNPVKVVGCPKRITEEFNIKYPYRSMSMMG